MAEKQSSLPYPELGENNYLNNGFDGFLRRDSYDLTKEFPLSEQSQLGLGSLAGSDILAWGDVYDDGNKPENDADVTSTHTSADTTAVNGLASTTLISASKIGSNLVVEGSITADAVTATKINVVGLNGTTGRIIVADATDANVVTGGVNSYASTLIAPGKILISGATVLSDWASGTDATKIDGGDIYTGTVTATQISVTNLAAINADLGTVTAGTITGLTIQTSASANTGVKITSGVITCYGTSAYFKSTAGVAAGTLIGGSGGNFDVAADGELGLSGATCNITANSLQIDSPTNITTSLQCDSLRIDQAPTTGLTADQHVGFACTASFTISLNGVSYKIPCVAA